MDPSSTHGPCLGVQESIGRDLLLLICTQIIFRSLQPAGAAHAPQLRMPSLLGHYYVLQALIIWMLYLDLFLLVTNPPLVSMGYHATAATDQRHGTLSVG